MPDILPDSRLADPKATVMADWPLLTGGTVRLELEPIYCFVCGKPNGYVPSDLMDWVSWLCPYCSETWGVVADQMMAPDHEFWETVHQEMIARFGRALTQQEIWELAERGRLGSALEKLERESPVHV